MLALHEVGHLEERVAMDPHGGGSGALVVLVDRDDVSILGERPGEELGQGRVG